jgi:hypothetical protein
MITRVEGIVAVRPTRSGIAVAFANPQGRSQKLPLVELAHLAATHVTLATGVVLPVANTGEIEANIAGRAAAAGLVETVQAAAIAANSAVVRVLRLAMARVLQGVAIAANATVVPTSVHFSMSRFIPKT